MTRTNECYGKYRTMPNCRNCRYRASCEYYTFSSKLKRSRVECCSVNYDLLADRCIETADISEIPGNSREYPEENITIEKLAQFFRYLLNLDKYTLSMLKMFFDDNAGNGEIPSVADKAERRGCSRQAVHRKILDVIKQHPELSKLFLSTLRHLPRDRRRYAGA